MAMSGGRVSSVDAFLPVTKDSVTGAYAWPEIVKRALLGLAEGPMTSQSSSGEALYDCIVDMRRESGFPHTSLSGSAAAGLTLFFDDLMPYENAQIFFNSTLPAMAKLALHLPVLLETHNSSISSKHDVAEDGSLQMALNSDMVLQIMHPQQAGLVLLSQEMVAGLLACSFFCLYPTQERRRDRLPDINFDRLFGGVFERGERIEQKMLCIVNYFERVCGRMPQGMVSFERKVLPSRSEGSSDSFWCHSKSPLCPITVMEDGSIENAGHEYLQVDFANKFLGGGALREGCVQEEIRFMISPELIAGMLFLPAMADNESIEIVGAERFSSYEGYASGFRFTGDYLDNTSRDAWGRRQTRIIAIDALSHPGEDQFRLDLMDREMNKAFCGFLETAGCRRGASALPLSGEASNGLASVNIIEARNTTKSARSGAGFANDTSGFVESVSYNDWGQVEMRGKETVDTRNTDLDLCNEHNARSLKEAGTTNNYMQSNIVNITEAASEDQGYDGRDQTSEGARNVSMDTNCRSLDTRDMTSHARHETTAGIATGNWGCGAFGGNLQLKSMLQWLAASQAGRPNVLYFTFKNPEAQRLQEIVDWIMKEGWCVGELWSMLVDYGKRRLSRQGCIEFFDWLLPQPSTDLASLVPYEGFYSDR